MKISHSAHLVTITSQLLNNKALRKCEPIAAV
jgi:hypothetical protein